MEKPAPSWLSDFSRPPIDFRPVPFWSWNETMEPAEVRRQCRVIHDAGWGGAFLHARIGLRTSDPALCIRRVAFAVDGRPVELRLAWADTRHLAYFNSRA